jgi:alkanesulfonate monooxygenase
MSQGEALRTPDRLAPELFSTCPPPNRANRSKYLHHVRDVARWSEDAGYRGILVYSDNRLPDPWLLSDFILRETERLMPLVAVQPVYMHPYTAAKMVSTFGYLHDRSVYLNMVAGGFTNDLVALDDRTPHDERYDRVVEYSLVVKALLAGTSPVTFHGNYYNVDKLRMTPPLQAEKQPGIFISGSSPAGLAAARALDATAIKYPQPVDVEETVREADVRCGIRLGIIARPTSEEAWSVASSRFPEDRRGQIAHTVAMKVSDSRWHRQLSSLEDRPYTQDDPYWLGPFKNYKTFCPYLVGSYERVAVELGRYLGLGFSTIILDIPASRAELEHIQIAVDGAADRSNPAVPKPR